MSSSNQSRKQDVDKEKPISPREYKQDNIVKQVRIIYWEFYVVMKDDQLGFTLPSMAWAAQ